MNYFSDYSFEGDRRISVDYGPETGEAIFVRRCEKCCRFVRPDELITNPTNHEATNATCSKCGRTRMIWEGFL